MAVYDLLLPALPTPSVVDTATSANPEFLLTGERAFWLAKARRYVGDVLAGANLSMDTLEATLLALEEVVVEALRLSGSRSVTVEVGPADGGTVEVVVRERGATTGFDAAGLTGLDRHAHEWGVTRRLGSSQAWFRVPHERQRAFTVVP